VRERHHWQESNQRKKLFHSSSNNGLMHGDELGAVGEGGFDLDVRNHLGHAIHHVGTGEHIAAIAHQLRHGFAVARALHHGGTDEGHGLGVVELQATGLSALGQQGGGEDQELVFFAGGEFHSAWVYATCVPCFAMHDMHQVHALVHETGLGACISAPQVAPAWCVAFELNVLGACRPCLNASYSEDIFHLGEAHAGTGFAMAVVKRTVTTSAESTLNFWSEPP